jgi:hypothetical protein
MRASFMSAVRPVPTTAGSGAAKINVSPWNMFVTAQRWTCFAPSAEKECTTPSSSWRQPLPVSCISSSFHS